MAPRPSTSQATSRVTTAPSEHRLAFNADAVAIVLALTFAALVRLNVIHHIGW